MKKSLLLCTLILACSTLHAQDFEHNLCKKPESFLLKAKTTIATAEEDDYDIHHVKLDLQIDDQSAAFKGMAQIDAKVVAASLPVFAFELHDTLTIDSFKLNGQILPVQTLSGNSPFKSEVVRKVFLPAPLLQNANFSAEIYYHSPDPFNPIFHGRGVRSVGLNGERTTFTISQPYFSNHWWPCKQSLTDKIDSTDIWITAPDSFKVGSQGLLKNITAIAPGLRRFEWKSNYPVVYYLISFAASNTYSEHSYYMHFTGSSDSMLIQNYVLKPTPADISALDSVGHMVNFFSYLLGRYPFWKEKYGHCWSVGGPSMEHQTMTTLNHSLFVIPHELAHQWFGDNVTCGTARDIWLNEGLATYMDNVWFEHIGKNPHWEVYMRFAWPESLYLDDTLYVGPPGVAYGKGAGVARMLRYIAPSDSVFFGALKSYQATFGGATATTADFQTVFETAYGRPLDTFFNQWVYSKGIPIYGLRYTQTATQTIIRVIQTPTQPASVPYFYMPLEITFRSAGGDTVVKINPIDNNEVFIFNWSKPLLPSQPFAIDSNHFVICKSVPSVKDSSLLTVTGVQTSRPTVYPNPTTGSWTVEGLAAGTQLTLWDMDGKVKWASTATSQKLRIPDISLNPGVYILELFDTNGARQIFKVLLNGK